MNERVYRKDRKQLKSGSLEDFIHEHRINQNVEDRQNVNDLH